MSDEDHDVDLAQDWESKQCVRARAHKNSMITMWPNQSQIGVPTSPACSLNSVPLTCLAKWWVQRSDEPKAVPIDPLRRQAGVG